MNKNILKLINDPLIHFWFHEENQSLLLKMIIQVITLPVAIESNTKFRCKNIFILVKCVRSI